MGGYDPGFRSVTEEHDAVQPDVTGTIPGWLDGTLVRNGPGLFEVDGERVGHWFDGLAMLTRYGFADGDVWFSNRFLRSETYTDAVENGHLRSQFGTTGNYLQQLYSLVAGTPTDNTNVTVRKLGGEYLALTETPVRVGFDPVTLETTGTHPVDDLPGQHVTAHHERDPERGVTLGYGTEFGRQSAYHLFRIPDGDLRRERFATIETDKPAYLHSFAITEEYAVVTEHPYTTTPLSLLSPGTFADAFTWHGDRQTTFYIVERATGDVVATPTAPPLFIFHHVDARQDGDSIVLDAVAYDDAGIVESLFLDAVEELFVAEGQLRRYRLPLDGGRVGQQTVAETYFEMPRTASERYVYGQATGRENANGLVKVDRETGATSEWWEEDTYVEEPTVVPAPDADAPDDGVVLATAVDTDTKDSVLLVFDADTLDERARVHLPTHVPFGFHGEFFPQVPGNPADA
jgi:carotenoid cleavage dioxygenase-like enzyme